jgi:hypothetical protein
MTGAEAFIVIRDAMQGRIVMAHKEHMIMLGISRCARLTQIDKPRVILGRANVLGRQGPAFDESDDQGTGIGVMDPWRKPGGMSRKARGGFRFPHNVVRWDVAANPHDVPLSHVFDEKIVVGQSARERNRRYAPLQQGRAAANAIGSCRAIDGLRPRER